MAKKASTKRQNRILASLSILLVLGSSVPVGAVGAWMMKIIGAVAILILLVSLCRMPAEEERSEEWDTYTLRKKCI